MWQCARACNMAPCTQAQHTLAGGMRCLELSDEMFVHLAHTKRPGAGASYRRAMWMPKDWVWTAKAQLVRNFLSRQVSGARSPLSNQTVLAVLAQSSGTASCQHRSVLVPYMRCGAASVRAGDHLYVQLAGQSTRLTG